MSNTLPKHVNLYQDEHSGGWILEVQAVGGQWYRFGVYGSRQSAVQCVSTMQ